MKKAFTIVEVSILLVIFVIVALLVAPISLDDTTQARNTSIWRTIQTDFDNIFYSVKNRIDENPDFDFRATLENILESETKASVKTYKISYLNNKPVNNYYKFDNYKQTLSDSTLALKFLPENTNNVEALIMYDVNGNSGPNVWGKDVFGYSVYRDRLEPFCKGNLIDKQKLDCSKQGSGICCSNYYLIGGSFDD